MKVPGITKNWWQAQMNMQLRDLRGFVETVEKGFATKLKRARKRPFEAPKRLKSDRAVEKYYRDRSNEIFALSAEFPSLVRRTAFVHLYSLLERRLLTVCEGIHRDQPHLPSPDEDRKNRGIVKAQGYLLKPAPRTALFAHNFSLAA